jgi:hypothetical protein
MVGDPTKDACLPGDTRRHGESAAARGVTIVRIVGIERHHHAGAAHMAPAPAGERLRAGFGHAE